MIKLNDNRVDWDKPKLVMRKNRESIMVTVNVKDYIFDGVEIEACSAYPYYKVVGCHTDLNKNKYFLYNSNNYPTKKFKKNLNKQEQDILKSQFDRIIIGHNNVFKSINDAIDYNFQKEFGNSVVIPINKISFGMDDPNENLYICGLDLYKKIEKEKYTPMNIETYIKLADRIKNQALNNQSFLSNKEKIRLAINQIPINNCDGSANIDAIKAVSYLQEVHFELNLTASDKGALYKEEEVKYCKVSMTTILGDMSKGFIKCSIPEKAYNEIREILIKNAKK